ncbi:TetR/AcrR family transcriptional regulator [Myceligenerans crystallogenes]
MVQQSVAGAGRRGRPGYDRQGILDVAVATFIERGYDATSIALLADRLGLSKSAIYHHFPSKEQILAAALDEALDSLEAALVPAGDDAGRSTPRGELAQLEHVLREAVHVLVERLPYVTLLLRVRGNTETERSALARRRAFDRQVRALIEAAQHSGELRSDIDARVAERLLFGMINSIVEWYRPGGRESAQSLADDVVALTLDGLRTP